MNRAVYLTQKDAVAYLRGLGWTCYPDILAAPDGPACRREGREIGYRRYDLVRWALARPDVVKPGPKPKAE